MSDEQRVQPGVAFGKLAAARGEGLAANGYSAPSRQMAFDGYPSVAKKNAPVTPPIGGSGVRPPPTTESKGK